MAHEADLPVSLWPDPQGLGTLTDLYQLTMMAGYAASGMADRRATFELFVRKLPQDRAYLIFAGLEQAIGDLARLAFSDEQVEGLRHLPALEHIDPSWFDSLRSLRFTGDVWAAPEGSVVFAGEPIVRVEAPLPLAQWVETYLISALAYPTMVASKAARIVEAARGKSLIDFGARRGHGPHAGLICARASYLAGFDGTSHVEAALRLGIPCVGTMAHSWVQSFGDEADAFAAFARAFPDNSTLLVDTYDTAEGVRLAAAIEPPVRGVRIDSGNLGALALEARAILDSLGRSTTQIVVSNDLNERKIDALASARAPIDSFGVGTELITSRDAPALSMVYKLVAVDGQGRVKLSPGKITYPLAKQVFRRRDRSGRFSGDHIVRFDEEAEGEPLLVPIMRCGEWVGAPPKLPAIREYCQAQRQGLPDRLRSLDATAIYPITYSDSLQVEARRLGIEHA
jgi:nicotinate phosphoribosyltransferase